MEYFQQMQEKLMVYLILVMVVSGVRLNFLMILMLMDYLMMKNSDLGLMIT